MPGPVLSEQMAVAPPMVSQAARTRTKLLSFIICFMLHSSQRHWLSRSLQLESQGNHDAEGLQMPG